MEYERKWFLFPHIIVLIYFPQRSLFRSYMTLGWKMLCVTHTGPFYMLPGSRVLAFESLIRVSFFQSFKICFYIRPESLSSGETGAQTLET